MVRSCFTDKSECFTDQRLDSRTGPTSVLHSEIFVIFTGLTAFATGFTALT
jgi:hypothetical protein